MSSDRPAPRHGSRGWFLLGCTAFGGYLAWNAFWLFRGRLPPSILTGLTGLPSPTTGLTRSTLALIAGDWRASLLWHPLAVPIWILFVLSLVRLFQLRLSPNGQPAPRTGARLLQAWLALLVLSWIAKFWLGPAWW